MKHSAPIHRSAAHEPNRPSVPWLFATPWLLCWAPPALAQNTNTEPPAELTSTGAIPIPDAAGGRDEFEVSARSRTTVAGFQRALLPGPGGAIITTQTLAPLHEAVSAS